MNEFYWISVLGNLNGISMTIAIIAGVVFIVAFLFIVEDLDNDEFVIRKTVIISGIVSVIFTIITCFIPSKKDLYLIYGAGTIVDYCQDNSKVKELPNKAVDAINIWLDMINEEKEE